MAILSSHLLNSVNGKHAGKVNIKIFIIDQNGNKDIFLKTSTGIGGRMSEEFSLSEKDKSCEFEMVVASGEYFSRNSVEVLSERIVSEIVIKFTMKDNNKKYHIPIMMSPNSYSVWWSE